MGAEDKIAVQESRIIVPRQGVPAQFAQYDFMVSYIHPSMAQWGRNVDQVWMAGVVAEEQAAAAEVFQCGEAIVYTGSIIRKTFLRRLSRRGQKRFGASRCYSKAFNARAIEV